MYVAAETPLASARAVSDGGRRPRDTGRSQALLLGAVGLGVSLVLFEVAVRSGILDDSVIPSLVDIFAAFWGLLQAGDFWSEIGATLSAWAIALTVAVIAGSVIGLVVGSSQLLRVGLRPVVDAMRSTSAVALIPVAILAFGLGTQMKSSLGIYAAIWPMLIGGISGAAAVERTLRDLAALLHWSRARVLFRLVLPSAAPYLAVAIRTSSVVVLAVVISTEIVTGSPGIGRVIALTQTTGVGVADMYASVLAAGLLGLTIDAALARVERRLVRWQPAHRGS